LVGSGERRRRGEKETKTRKFAKTNETEALVLI